MGTSAEQFVVDAKGHRTSVILSVARYEQLLEDVHDLAVVTERRDEKLVSLEEMRGRAVTRRSRGTAGGTLGSAAASESPTLRAAESAPD